MNKCPLCDSAELTTVSYPSEGNRIEWFCRACRTWLPVRNHLVFHFQQYWTDRHATKELRAIAGESPPPSSAQTTGRLQLLTPAPEAPVGFGAYEDAPGR